MVNRPRVLVVDDESAIIRSVRRRLPSARYDVRFEEDPFAAVAAIAAEPFDVIVCDVNMPGKSGPGVWEDAVRSRPEVADRFVFMTTGTPSESFRAFLGSVKCGRLDKVVDLERFASALDRELERLGIPHDPG